MDDNIINQNQNFYIPKNDDDEKEDSTTVSDGSAKKDDAINHRDINVTLHERQICKPKFYSYTG